MNSKLSFYLEQNNILFKSDVLVVCYKADEKEIKKYNLTSNNIIIFIKNDGITHSKIVKNADYISLIKKFLKIKKLF